MFYYSNNIKSGFCSKSGTSLSVTLDQPSMAAAVVNIASNKASMPIKQKDKHDPSDLGDMFLLIILTDSYPGTPDN